MGYYSFILLEKINPLASYNLAGCRKCKGRIYLRAEQAKRVRYLASTHDLG
jgi:hypothetical protein